MQHPPDAQVQASTRVIFRLTHTEGHCVLGTYVEDNWLPVLGPTCFCLARHVATIGADGNDVICTYGPLATALGVSPAKVRDAIIRLCRFGPAEWFHPPQYQRGGIIIVPNGWPDAPLPKAWR